VSSLGTAFRAPTVASVLRRARVARHAQDFAVLLTIVLISLYTALREDSFFTWANLFNVLGQTSVLGILAVGMTIVMISGGIDLSIGSLVSLTGVIGGTWIAHGNSFWWVLPATVAIGGGVGTATGTLIARSRVQPFVVTLGGLSLLQGLALLVVHGQQVSLFVEGPFNGIGSGSVGRMPISAIIMLGVFVVAYVALTYTRIGRNLYSIGGNETAAYLSGLRVDLYKIGVYGVLGALGGLASIILASRIGGALPLMGSGLELQAIAAVVIGGVALTGGRGTVVGGLLGVALLGVIQDALNLLSIQTYYQTMIVGIIIIAAVVTSRAQRAARV
jgi:ribose/xylose/arabinose/galactoside ABC-type transport system permease subunit